MWVTVVALQTFQRKSVFARPLPNADFLSSDWFMSLWRGQPFSFEIFLVMSL